MDQNYSDTSIIDAVIKEVTDTFGDDVNKGVLKYALNEALKLVDARFNKVINKSDECIEETDNFPDILAIMHSVTTAATKIWNAWK